MRGLPLVRVLSLTVLLGAQAQESEREVPRQLGLTERTERRLVQVELVVDGPADRVAALVPADLEVRVARKRITAFALDLGCAAGTPAVAAPEAAQAPTPSSTPASIALYFDQAHLVTQGRVRALQSAEQLASALLQAGHRVRIVSNGTRLRRWTPWTIDGEVVRQGLRALSAAPPDPLANAWEDTHLERIGGDADDLNQREKSCTQRVGGEVQPDVTLRGRTSTQLSGCCFQWEFERILQDLEYEATHAVMADEDSLERLSSFLLEMEGLPGSRAVVLYADTLRRHAGAALLKKVRDRASFRELLARCPYRESLSRTGTGAHLGLQRDASLAVDAVLREAAARRVRVHTVQAQGMTTDDVSETEALLAELALESGGRSFRGAATEPRRVIEAVLRDASCPVVLSLDPEVLPAGRLIGLTVRSRVKDVKVRAPGLVFSEPPERTRGVQHLAALLRADDAPGQVPVLVGTVPLGRDEDGFLALAQVIAPPAPPRTPRWDLEAYTLASDVADREASASITARPAGVPAVLETIVRLPSGPSEVVGIAHDLDTDELGAMRRHETWPRLRSARAGLSPLALLQPATGGFVRDGATRRAGPLTVSPEQGPDPGRPLTLVGVACRGTGDGGALILERTLLGARDYPFPPVTLELAPRECAQFRDTVPANALTPGGYRYAARILAGGEAITEQTVSFAVPGP
ncbi:MAG TPA: hypothetical protein VFV75_06860 [Candidatus Polarisedimenticolaceae bacterium]|nr:hypothetical protein [Candidatus Polarisedimenticolaceae bacterium]